MEADQPLPSVEQVVARVWPDGMPDSEKIEWNNLSPIGRSKALRRMLAIQRLLAPLPDEEPFRNAASAALFAEMSASSFYAMLNRWQHAPGLASVGVRSASNNVRAGGDEKRAYARKFLEYELSSTPDLGTQELLNRLAAEGHTVSKTSALRLVADVRRNLPITGLFGRILAIDSAGMDLVDDFGERLRLHATIDVDTGLALGWSVLQEGIGLEGYAIVAERAVAGLSHIDLTGARSTSPALFEIRNPPNDRASNVFLQQRMRLAPLPRAQDERQTGGRIVRTLGDRVSGIWIGSGQRLNGLSYRTGRADPMPTVSDAVLDDIGTWIAAHNAERLQRLPRDGDKEELARNLEALGAQLSDLGAMCVGNMLISQLEEMQRFLSRRNQAERSLFSRGVVTRDP